MEAGTAELLAAWATVAIGATLGVLRPTWIVPALFLVAPLRLPVTAGAELSTLLLLGAALGRGRAITRAVSERPAIAAAFLSLPLWMLVSSFWTRQPWFAVREAGKWFAVALAGLLAFADPRRDPKALVLAAAIAMVPSALWAAAERLHWIAPLGDLRELKLRVIVIGDLVRGRALFYHPNRLAEFTEQLGLFLAACAVMGPWRALAAAGVVAAVAGGWASGSAAGLATIVGGVAITVAALLVWPARGSSAAQGDVERSSRRFGRAVVFIAPALGVAAAAAVMAWRMHGGIGPRQLVYRKAWQAILRSPLVGLGAGGWAFEVAGDPMSRFWFASHTHSLALQVWVETGLVGLVLAALFFALPLWAGWRGVARSPLAWQGITYGAIAGVAALLTHDLVHFFLRQAADGIPTGLLLGLAAGALPYADAGEKSG